MNCSRARSLLMVYLDSELDSATVVAVQEHLDRCAECRRRFEREGVLESLLAERLSRERMPDDVWDRIRGSLAPRRAVRWRWLATAALLLVSLVLVLQDVARRDSGPIERQLVTAFRRAPSPVDPAFVLGRDAARTLLGEVGGGRLALPVDGVHDGHDLVLVGAVRQPVGGSPAINVRFECCGQDTSVYVMPAAALRGASAECRADGTEVVIDGVRAGALLRGDLLIGVVSSHAGVLLDELRS